MSLINQNSLQVAVSQNQYIPDEGPKVLPLLLDFTQADTYNLDAESLMDRGFLSMVQTIFIDLKDSTVAFTVTINGTGQIVKAKAHTQGYYPILCPNPVKLQFDCQNGPLMRVFLINVPIAGAVWATA